MQTANQTANHARAIFRYLFAQIVAKYLKLVCQFMSLFI